LIVRTPVVQLEFELFREDLPCKYSNTRSHSLFALATIREDMPQLVLAVFLCVVDADYIYRVKPVPWVLWFVVLVFLVLSSCCYVVQCNGLFSFDFYGG
jgi:hypothetical protein